MKTTVMMCVLSAFLGSIIALALTNWAQSTQAQNFEPDLRLGESSFVVSEESAGQEASPPPRVFTTEESVAIAVYEKVNRCVVNIRTVSESPDIFAMGPIEGAGSGWIYDRDGHIVTNNHVIADSDAIEVTLSDGKSVPAKLVGTDPPNDIAVLKIDVDAAALNPVEIGESSNLKVGQMVFAIGNPFGLERTMTHGIISSLNRSIPAKTRIPRTMNSIIQTDAALNQGNSGGPLLDTNGLLIGMNTAIATSTGENTGVGFAISANNIRRIVPLLIRDGRLVRASLGVASVFTTRRGVGVYQMVDGGPAAEAGIRGATWIERVRIQGGYATVRRVQLMRADHILQINGKPINSAESLLTEVEKFRPGDKVTVRILRGEREMDITVTLEEE